LRLNEIEKKEKLSKKKKKKKKKQKKNIQPRRNWRQGARGKSKDSARDLFYWGILAVRMNLKKKTLP